MSPPLEPPCSGVEFAGSCVELPILVTLAVLLAYSAYRVHSMK